MRVLGGGFVSLIGSQIRSYGGGAKAMNMAFIGIVLDGLGCLILVFTPMQVGYGGWPVVPKGKGGVGAWYLGWGMLVAGFLLQAIAAWK